MVRSSKSVRVMIAGVGGASLGTEIYKSLRLAGGYEVYGCDLSSTAYGLYEPGFANTYHVARENYVTRVIDACLDAGARFLIPGGEQPMNLLGAATTRLAAAGLQLLSNAPEVVSLCSDKDATFRRLSECGIAIPATIAVTREADLDHVGLPCIIKPSTGSGGSAGVFYAVSAHEAMLYAEFLRRTGTTPVAQEYIDAVEGEVTIGVLALPDAQVVGSIALRRALDTKLSVSYRGRGGVISSGYSQGHIGPYSALCQQAERIAAAIGNRGPMNIQGRVRDDVFVPFEINPRFSASTYLRALAGFNEVNVLLQYFVSGVKPARPSIKTGWYLRSLTEQYIPEEGIK